MNGAARPEELVGVVLAGGLSSRMGEHKPALRLGEGMPDLLSRTVDLLRSCTAEVWVSCRKGQSVPDCRCIHDLEEGLGPIGGIVSALTALARSPRQAALVVSCDLPFMHADILARLINARRSAKPGTLMTTFLQAETGYIEALTAIYEKEALPFFEQALAAGQRQINLVLGPDRREDVPYTRREALPFFNVNYPADLETARRQAAALNPAHPVKI
ncbi:MAG: molybdenum cofactor guanylyltransferase [Deltaproteobacteria bacterium]|jgi:molybdopterin-guanine dinucleotide biosynthesis protein A|nr:molybdenum cofactor guanylyltransferase [Deltaproteobacteria bacterium]